MTPDTLSLSFVALTCLVTAGAWACTRRAARNKRELAEQAVRSRCWLLGVLAFAAYTVCREVAVVALMLRSGIDPWTFLFVDLVNLVPWLIAAPRAARALLDGRMSAYAAWTSCLLIAALAPVAYVALVFKDSAGSVSTLAIAYLVVIVGGSAWGLLRKGKPRPGANVMQARTVPMHQ